MTNPASNSSFPTCDEFSGTGNDRPIHHKACDELSIAQYSVLNESKQLFASKYMLYLPTEEELRLELERERKLIEGTGATEEESD